MQNGGRHFFCITHYRLYFVIIYFIIMYADRDNSHSISRGRDIFRHHLSYEVIFVPRDR